METDITYADGSPGVGYVHNWNSFDCRLKKKTYVLRVSICHIFLQID